MKKKLLLLLVMPFALWLNGSAVNIIITRSIEASGYYSGADTLWHNYAVSMGYNAAIDSMSVLNDTSFFATTDVLVLSDGTAAISNTQMQNIITFVKRGKSAYIQSEYLSSFPGDITFQAIMDSAGANFSWVGIVSGQLVPMEILAPFSTTPYQTASISYYWYGQNGTGSGVDSFLEYNNQYFGFYYHQTCSGYGRVITQSDQDWVWEDYDSLLMKNILYQLVEIDSTNSVNVFPESPSICSGSSVLLTASGASIYTWSPATGLSATTGDSVVADPTTTTTYTLTGNNSCKGSTEVIVTVTPSLPLTIVPPSAIFCNGLSATLKITGEGSDFAWSPSQGLSTTTGDSVIASPTASITYTITGADSLGCVETGTVDITVIPSPNTPTFTQHDDTLISSSKNDNQWYRNDTLLVNDTSQYLIITTLGEYWVEVNNEANGCSTASDSMNISSVTGVSQLSFINNQLSIYPNPFSNRLTVTSPPTGGPIDEVDVTNELGQILLKIRFTGLRDEIDLSNLSSGVYFITVINKTGRVVFPVVKQN